MQMGYLTTHILDTAQGKPAANLLIELWRLDLSGNDRALLTSLRTNADGRADQPLVEGVFFSAGEYELIFDVGEYFETQGVSTATPPLLGRVPVRFGVADPTAHYHVPLLVSPWSYSTYRGS
jgi:5-hydroxyisourate hydrolase